MARAMNCATTSPVAEATGCDDWLAALALPVSIDGAALGGAAAGPHPTIDNAIAIAIAALDMHRPPVSN